MERALGLAAEAAARGEVPVGALVLDTATGAVLAEAGNTREAEQDPCGHAELTAIRAAAKARGDFRLSGCTVYVTLEPCAMCAGAMVLARIDRCVYAAADPKGGYLGTLGNLADVAALNHRFAVTPGVLADESAALLRSFFRGRRR